jgi:hypothetical protein
VVETGAPVEIFVAIAAKQARKAHQTFALLPVSKYIYIHRGRDRMVV